MIFDIQLNPAVDRWEAVRDAVQLAEDLGFTTAWTFDHFDGSVLRGDRMLECFTLLGALATSTTSIGLGSLVVNVANRNPGVLAVAAASVQVISGGRFILGVGAGAAPGTRWSAEHRAFGIELGRRIADRHQRLADTLDIVERWWSSDANETRFLHPAPPPPIIVGVNSPSLAAFAARRTDGINVRGSHDDLDAIIDAARAARRAREGDDPASRGREMVVSVWAEWDDALADPDHPSRRRWAALGVNRLVMVWLNPLDLAAIARFAPR